MRTFNSAPATEEELKQQVIAIIEKVENNDATLTQLNLNNNEYAGELCRPQLEGTRANLPGNSRV